MMTAPRTFVASLSLLLAVGCSQRQSPSPSDTAGAVSENPEAIPQRLPAPDPATLELLARSGSDAALVVVLEEHDWESIGAVLVRDFGASRSSVRTPLTFLSKQLRLPLPELDHRDKTRPLVVSLMAAPYLGPAGYAFAMALPLAATQPPARHSLEIPSESTEKLLDELSHSLGDTLKASPFLVGGIEGAQAFEVPMDGEQATFIALVPESTFVRLVVLQGSRGLTLAEARHRLRPPAQPHEDTPAVRAFAASQGTRLYLRPDNLRSFQSWSGVSEVYAAAESLTPVMATLGVPRGLAEAASTASGAPDDTQEAYDHAWALEASAEGIHLRGVATLTKQGRAAFGRAADHLATLPFPGDVTALTFSEVFEAPAAAPRAGPISSDRLDRETSARGAFEVALYASPGAIVYDVAMGRAPLPKIAPRVPFFDAYIRTGPTPQAANCLLDAVQKARSLFQDRSVDRLHLDPLGPALECAASDPQLTDAASRLGTAVTMILATRAVASGTRDDAIDVLDWRCSAAGEDDPACGYARDLKLFVVSDLPPSSADAGCVADGEAFPLVHKNGKFLVGTRAVVPRREQLRDALLTLIPAHHRGAENPVSFSLAAAPDTAFSELRPLFEAVGDLRGRLLPLVLNDDKPQPLTADLRSTSSATFDWKLGPHYVPQEHPVYEDESSRAPPERSTSEKTIELKGSMRWRDLVKAAESCDEQVVFVLPDER